MIGSKKGLYLNDFMESIIEPFKKDYSQYDILRHVSGNSNDSPAVTAVKKLRNNVSTMHSNQLSEKDAAAMGSFGISRNTTIAHDVASRKELKSVIEKPSEYVHGLHLSEIKEQAELLKKYKKGTIVNLKSCATPPSVTPVIKSSQAMARSYRNGLDHKYVEDSMTTRGFVTPQNSHSNIQVSKPKYDWVKEVRKECIRQMAKATNDNKPKLVSLIRIINHQDPASKFEDIKNVYEDSIEMDENLPEIVATMMCFV